MLRLLIRREARDLHAPAPVCTQGDLASDQNERRPQHRHRAGRLRGRIRRLRRRQEDFCEQARSKYDCDPPGRRHGPSRPQKQVESAFKGDTVPQYSRLSGQVRLSEHSEADKGY